MYMYLSTYVHRFPSGSYPAVLPQTNAGTMEPLGGTAHATSQHPAKMGFHGSTFFGALGVAPINP